MAPPTLVHSRAEIQRQYHDQLTNPEKYQCSLKSLIQNECTFRVLENRVQETICIPFKRIFQRCLLPYTETVEGKKKSGLRWINIETTDWDTNETLRRESYGAEVQKFLAAETDLRKWLENAAETQD